MMRFLIAALRPRALSAQVVGVELARLKGSGPRRFSSASYAQSVARDQPDDAEAARVVEHQPAAVVEREFNVVVARVEVR